eukprot:TRINITY_DN8226_c0_g1_i1.p1 TRINITY_DN8226_c0_g1~~TRINITY_DN8226_c0_g1_i1.p1  ORF type:complete len:565 (+),score=81.70 TRINITY_DN8226_c0_g1_i1:44-1738(+)
MDAVRSFVNRFQRTPIQSVELGHDDFENLSALEGAIDLPDDFVSNDLIDEKIVRDMHHRIRTLSHSQIPHRIKLVIAELVACYLVAPHSEPSHMADNKIWASSVFLQWIKDWGLSADEISRLKLHFEAEIDATHGIPSEVSIPEEYRLRILCDLLQFCTEQHSYDSRLRVSLTGLCIYFQLPKTAMDSLEGILSAFLSAPIQNPDPTLAQHQKRWAKILLGVVVGGGLVAVGGSILSSVMLGAAHFLGSTVTVSTLTMATAFGVAGGGLGGYRMTERTSALSDAQFHHIKGEGMVINIVVDGFMLGDAEEIEIWRRAFSNPMRASFFGGNEGGNSCTQKNRISGEVYIMQWETELLKTLGEHVIACESSSEQKPQGRLFSRFSSFLTHNPLQNSAEATAENKILLAAELLKHVLLGRVGGCRPVRLIGYSHGCSVIYSCLEMMAQSGPKALGIVEHVVLMGAPIVVDSERWRKTTSVVSGHVYNAHSSRDAMLISTYGELCAGVNGVQNIHSKVVDVDVSHCVDRHSYYGASADEVLGQIDFFQGIERDLSEWRLADDDSSLED